MHASMKSCRNIVFSAFVLVVSFPSPSSSMNCNYDVRRYWTIPRIFIPELQSREAETPNSDILVPGIHGLSRPSHRALLSSHPMHDFIHIDQYDDLQALRLQHLNNCSVWQFLIS